MKDLWYGDNRDLVKWTTLVHLAQRLQLRHILQILYYRPSTWHGVEVDGENVGIPESVKMHFRDAASICGMKCGVTIEILDAVFDGAKRGDYQRVVRAAIAERSPQPGVVFLDPDTGLEPPGGNFGPTHVRERELSEIWNSLGINDALVLYQHETNRKGQDFIAPKKEQFAKAIGVPPSHVKHAHAPGIARDVAFLFAVKA